MNATSTQMTTDMQRNLQKIRINSGEEKANKQTRGAEQLAGMQTCSIR